MAQPLNAGSSPQEWVAQINALHAQVAQLQGSVVQLLSAREDHKKKDITEFKAFEKVPLFDGDVASFKDFEFKLQRFV